MLAAAATRLLVSGSEQLFPPLQLLDLAVEASLTSANYAAAAHTSNAGVSYWQAAASRTATNTSLNIAVLGASVTSGCGGNELPHEARCQTNGSTALSRLCAQQGGWARHMQDDLAARVRAFGSLSPVSTDVHPRNAVSGSYFAHCACGFATESTGVK